MVMPEPVSGVLLAAGASTRFAADQPKQIVTFGGEPLVRRAARQMLASSLAEVIVVTGFEWAAVESAVAGLPVRFAHNSRFLEGQSTSVVTGLGAVDATSGAACFVPCDQPFLDAATIDRLIATRRGGIADEARPAGRQTRRIWLPVFAERRGAPVIFDRQLFGALAALGGDEGGRQVIRRNEKFVRAVCLPDPAPLLDVDTTSDLAALEALL